MKLTLLFTLLIISQSFADDRLINIDPNKSTNIEEIKDYKKLKLDPVIKRTYNAKFWKDLKVVNPYYFIFENGIEKSKYVFRIHTKNMSIDQLPENFLWSSLKRDINKE